MDEALDEFGEELRHLADLNTTAINGTTPSPIDGFDSPFFTEDVFDTGIHEHHSCKAILYQTIGINSTIRVWDVIILIPNLIFLIFLCCRLQQARQKLRATNSLIFKAFYVLVLTSAFVSVIRCLVSMSMSAATPTGDEADKILWVGLRFILLATEMSVVVFGMAAGHLDSKRSIRRVIIVASCISLLFSVTQFILEIDYPDPRFHVATKKIDLFGHGGMVFWALSSAIFTLIYAIILLMPILPCRHSLTLPNRRSFYQYIGFLLILNAFQTAGSILVYAGIPNGLCFLNLTTYLYFTTFTPIVYFTFLRGFFKVAQPTLLFSYKAQVDDFDVDGHGEQSQPDLDDDNDGPIVLNSRPFTTSTVQEGVASPESVANFNFGH